MLNLQDLYSVAKDSEEYRYNFFTDSGVEYSAYFICMDSYGEKLNNTYMFNFDRLSDVRIKEDYKIKNTICGILLSFLNNNKKAIIYVCDSSDEREEARNKMFSKWYNDLKVNDFERFDISTKTDYYKVFSSLFVHKDNPEKVSISKAFSDIIRDISVIE